jgi:formylglycine-generating enzyme required for sulfatase activity
MSQQLETVINEADRRELGLSEVLLRLAEMELGCSITDRACQDEEYAGTAQFANEAPRHRVFISRGFWMGRTEVTIGDKGDTRR